MERSLVQTSALRRCEYPSGRETFSALGTISDANRLEGHEFTEVIVPKKRLDDFDLPPIGFIKIDVEGHAKSRYFTAPKRCREGSPKSHDRD